MGGQRFAWPRSRKDDRLGREIHASRPEGPVWSVPAADTGLLAASVGGNDRVRVRHERKVLR